MPAEPQILSIAHAIQLAVTPVFLLTGIGAFLSVLTNRLARIVDRARHLEGRLTGSDEAMDACTRTDLAILSRRARLVNWAINLCTTCALFVCTVIVVLFVAAFIAPDIALPIALLFIVALTALIVALLIFLREIYLATSSLRIGPR